LKSKFSKAERRALNLLFLPFGVGAMATSTRFPEIRDNLQVNNGVFGTYLTLGGIGSLIAFIFVGNIVHKIGIKPVILVASTGLFGTMAAIPHIKSPLIFLLINILLALSWVAFHICNNGQAVHRQEEIGELILPKLHGLWSLGALLTSILAIAITPYVSLAWHIGTLMFLMWIPTVYGIMKSTPYFIDKSDDETGLPRVSIAGLIASVKSQPVIAISMVLAMQIEFSIQDWSAIFSKDSIGMSASASIYGYTVFIGAMIIFRLNVQRLHKAFSEAQLLKFLPLLGGIGFIVFIPLGTIVAENSTNFGFALALIGFALAGFGSSILAPTFFGIAFRTSSLPSSVVVAQLGLISAVVTFFIKIVISWVAQATSVTVALMIPALMLLATSRFSHLGRTTKD
jgi:MFS family permease